MITFSSSFSSSSKFSYLTTTNFGIVFFWMLPGFFYGLNMLLKFYFDSLDYFEEFAMMRSAFSSWSNLATAPLVILLVPFLINSLCLSFCLSATTYSIGLPEKFHSLTSSIFDKFCGLLFLSKWRNSVGWFLKPYLFDLGFSVVALEDVVLLNFSTLFGFLGS